MKELRAALNACLLLIVVCFALPALGQSACWTWVAYYFPEPLPPPGAYDCQTQGPWQGVCKVNTKQCAPPNAADEAACGACSPAAAGQPINLANGNTYIIETDLGVPGLGGGLALTRTWNSRWPASQSAFSGMGAFGLNWRSSYEERIFVGGDGYIKYLRGDASFWSFGYVSSSSGVTTYEIAAPMNAQATLVRSSADWILALRNGEHRVFDAASGSLIGIVDRNGNATTLSYDGSNRLVAVTDPASRSLYFNYEDPSSAYLATSVTSSIGISVSFLYDSAGRLIQVTKADGETLSYEYDAQSMITAVKDSQGIVLEAHTYDSLGRGLTSSRASGVETVTVSYPQ